MPRVFVSYCHRDGKRGLVSEFVKRLQDEITRTTDWPEQDILYLDTSVRVGTLWSEELVSALRDCDVFLALYSPRYFKSEYCGKEWWLFAKRLQQYMDNHSVRPASLIPILWEAPSDSFSPPKFAADLQYTEGSFGAAYAELGLRRIVQHSGPHKKVYRSVIEQLTERITATISDHRLDEPGQHWSVEEALNAFANQIEERQDEIATPRKPQSGPNYVNFVVAAGKFDEMRQLREAGEIYGDRPEDWRPYVPAHAAPLALYATEIAVQREVLSSLIAIGPTLMLPDVISRAEQRNELVILLVDPWTAFHPAYRDLVRQYDDGLWLHTAVVIPWNDADVAPEDILNKVKANIRQVFRKNRLGRPKVYSDSAGNLEQFRAELHRVLIETQSLLFAEGEVVRSAAQSEDIITRPIISGPGGGM